MSYLMIVEDDEDFATAVATVLRDDGHEVAIELDIQRAVKSMRERRPDLVILDVMFPEDPSAGFELARSIQHDDENLKGIPILMLTAINVRFPLGFGSRDIDEEWLPVSDFLEKPIDLNVLRKKVADLLRMGNSDQTRKPEA